jgi:hypothetical protein
VVGSGSLAEPAIPQAQGQHNGNIEEASAEFSSRFDA